MKKLKVGFVLEDLNCQGFDYVMQHYKLTHGEVLGILENYVSQEHLDERITKFRKLLRQRDALTRIKAKRVGLLSDTHIGNKKANFDYIQRTYDFFDYYGVDVVLHLGDFFDGYSNDASFGKRNKKNYASFQNQLNEFQLNYPTAIPTYVLLGNHDEWFRDLGFDLFEIIPHLNPSMTVLAYGGHRVQINGRKFYLSHPIEKSYCVTNKNCEITLRGHSHYFEYNHQRRLFRLNTCSDTHPSPAGGDYELAGGFSILSFPKNMLCFENYSFYHDDIVKSLCLKI